MKFKRPLVLVLVLALAMSAVTGGTIAWFTDSVESKDNVIKSGNLDVELTYYDNDAETWKDASEGAIFDYDLWEPGYTQLRKVKVTNAGNLAFKFQLNIAPTAEPAEGEANLADAIEVYYGYKDVPGDLTDVKAGTLAGTISELAQDEDGMAYGVLLPEGTTSVNEEPVKDIELWVALHMKEEAGNEYQNLSIGDGFALQLLATQYTYEEDSFGNTYDEGAEYPVLGADTWDGTADTTWYNDTDTEFVITTAEQLAGLAELVDGGNNFAGKTIKVGKDLDLNFIPEGTTEPKSFDPIGDKSAFAGTFDGNGHTIENLYQSGWAFGYEWDSYGSLGLFGELESATVKNLTISGAETLVEGGDVSLIAGSATGTCVFENITLEDSVAATYNNGCGGIIGWSGAGNYTFKNITIADDVVLAGLWGSFDSSIGGIVGQGEPGATYNFENVDIQCRLDAYNDCTASYDYYNYRMCGMIIGRLAETTTINGTNYPDTSKYNITCNDVNVTYGDWANYHYCEPTPGYNNGRGMRVEPGYSYDGLPADYDHSQCVDNHMNLIPFDQIFGGDQLGVKGLKAYDGVNVFYNNK